MATISKPASGDNAAAQDREVGAKCPPLHVLSQPDAAAFLRTQAHTSGAFGF